MFDLTKNEALLMAIEYIQVSKDFITNPSYCSDDQINSALAVLTAYYKGASSYQILDIRLNF